MMMRPANPEASQQQRKEALSAFSITTPVVAARPWGGTKAEENPTRCAQVSALRSREAEVKAATPLAKAAAKQQWVLEAELRKAASVSAGNLRQDDLDEATVAPLLRWLTPHSAAWAMGRMATAVVRAARTASSWSAHRGRGQLQWIRSSLSWPTEGNLQRRQRRALSTPCKYGEASMT